MTVYRYGYLEDRGNANPHNREPVSKQSDSRRSFSSLIITFKLFPAAFLFGYAAPGETQILDIKTFSSLAQRCGASVATFTLAAIAKTESRFESLVVANNTTHISHTYQTVEQATFAASNLIAKGNSVDLGLMQINSANLNRLGMTVRDAFDPCKAIRAAASIMTSNFLASRRAPTQQIALRNALSMYNTGNTVYGYKNGYVQRVEASARSLAAYFYTIPSVQLTRNDQSGRVSEFEQITETWDVWK